MWKRVGPELRANLRASRKGMIASISRIKQGSCMFFIITMNVVATENQMSGFFPGWMRDLNTQQVLE